MWTGKPPELGHIRIFGCDALMQVPKELRNKIASKSKKRIFVGYEGNSTNYRLCDPVTKKINVSRNVSFNKDKISSEIRKNIAKIFVQTDENKLDERLHENLDNDKSCKNDSVDKNVENTVNNEPDVVDFSKANDIAKKYSLRSRDSIKMPIRFEANLADIHMPQTFEQAIQSDEKDKWNKAISEEVSALAKNETWDLLPLPKDKKTINSRWVFSLKSSENGNSPRFKARLCAKGYTQEKGIDYTDTFSPTVRYDSIRILLAIAVQRILKIKQFDIRTAFLNGHLQEEVYMLPPEGINIESGMVCRLKKALYGLKQASRQWNE